MNVTKTGKVTPVKPKSSSQLDVSALAAAHARTHKRLTIIEIMGVGLLVLFLLAGLAAWAYYQQESKAASTEPYSINEYQ